MSMPFYVSPEQLMKDRADFARKGTARGRPVVVLAYDGGIAFATENPSRALHKISEIYDRIAFAAVGKYNEFENLRVAGVRYADLRGYSYDRTDVNARGLANAYAQTLGTVFTTESKPLEVELVVAEVGPSPAEDQIYRISYDGSVADEQGFVVMGGQAEQLSRILAEGWTPEMTLAQVLRLGVSALGSAGDGAAKREIPSAQLEVAILDRSRPRRAFRRLIGPALEAALGVPDGPQAPQTQDESRTHDAASGTESHNGGAASAGPRAKSRAGRPEPKPGKPARPKAGEPDSE